MKNKVNIIIKSVLRKDLGKSACRRLRKKNEIPAIVYRKKNKNILIKVKYNEMLIVQRRASLYKEVFLLKIGLIEKYVKIKEIQFHAFKLKLIHIDFLLV